MVSIDLRDVPELVSGLPFADNSVDEITANGALDYVPEENVDFVVSEILRVLREGGRFDSFGNAKEIPQPEIRQLQESQGQIISQLISALTTGQKASASTISASIESAVAQLKSIESAVARLVMPAVIAEPTPAKKYEFTISRNPNGQIIGMVAQEIK